MPFVSPNSNISVNATLNSSHNGKTLIFDSDDAQTLTLPKGLPRGFQCKVVRTGTGDLTITADSGVALQNNSSLARYESAEIVKIGANTFTLSSSSSRNIGDAVGNGDAGSVLYVDENGDLAQSNNAFYFDAVTEALKLVDKDYVPFEGSLDADCLFSVGSNDNVQNNAGTITTSNHFVGVATDLKIVASGADKYHIGHFNQIRISGSHTGTTPLIGHWTFVCNRGSTASNSVVQAGYFSINLEGNASEAVGVTGEAYRGSNVTNPIFVGVRGIAANGYATASEVTAGDFWVKTASAAATITLGRSVWARATLGAGHSVTTLYGVDIGGWDNNAAVDHSAGLHIDGTVDVGGTTKYAILSESGAPSSFNGVIQLAELITPSNAPANSLYLYADDNGSGKTRLMVRFPSGSAIQLAIEP